MSALLNFGYLIMGILFILGIKKLSSPVTARRGNQMAAVGMLIGVVITLAVTKIVDPILIVVGLVVGAGLGSWMAKAVAMTSMPQMVALLNGFGGGGSELVASGEIMRLMNSGADVPLNVGISVVLSIIVGGVTLSGSLMAFGKLQELVTGRAVTFPMQKPLSALIFLGILVVGVLFVMTPGNMLYFLLLHGLALLLGVLLVIPIGGADMPVVISLLNSYSGVAAGLTGFVINNDGLIISGALVGASGLILTRIMCKAMNRSLANVIFGAFGAEVATGGGDGKGTAGKTVRQITVEDAAVLLGYARLAIIVPGYGLAVAQAQNEVREMADLIEKNGGEVKYAIHPVAGRMPGHMNVLLAEANVPYDKLCDMDAINPEFERADVALVVGANDVVNPAARHDTTSPIYGMPILDVDKAQHVIVLKRSMNPGFAGIENELFYDAKTSMLFGDAKASISKLVAELKAS